MSLEALALDVPGVRPPRQARSRATFDRILDTGAELFAEVGYDGFSITELCRRAGVSAGALYGRIASKDALVLAIHDRELTRMSADFAAFSDRARWDRLTTGALVHAAVVELGEHYGRHSDLLRGFFLRASVDEAMRRHAAPFTRRLATSVVDLLMSRASEIPHADPALAADMTYRMAQGSLSWRIAFGDMTESEHPIDWATYVNEIASSARAYLLTDAPA